MLSRQIFVLITEGMSGEKLERSLGCKFLERRLGLAILLVVSGSSKIDSEDRFVFWLFDLGKGGDDFKTLASLFLLL